MVSAPWYYNDTAAFNGYANRKSAIEAAISVFELASWEQLTNYQYTQWVLNGCGLTDLTTNEQEYINNEVKRRKSLL